MNLAAPNSTISQQGGEPTRSMAVWLSKSSQIITALTSSGLTANRPTAFLYVSRTYFDTSLGIPVWWDGTNWVNATGSTV